MTGLYIHIPFCQQKCFYCDFLSLPSNHDQTGEYLKALLKEMDYYSQSMDAGQVFDTVFIGGGTPSLLKIEELEEIFQALFKKFKINPVAEITIECNPESLTFEKIVRLEDLGVNRFSLGVQSFDQGLLEKMGRTHNRERAVEAIEDFKRAKVENFSLDFIYGLPQQSLEQWQESLRLALKFKPNHLSLYNLMVSEGTVFAELAKQGRLELPSEEEQVQMLEMAVALLAAENYSHYEIANFAQPGFESKHNLIYWRNQQYLGLGVGAFSYWQGERRGNTLDLGEYIKTWTEDFQPVFSEIEKITPQQEETETIIMALRLQEGISYEKMKERFQIDFLAKYEKAIDWAISSGLAEEVEGQVFRLTEKGIPVSNQVMIRFLP